MAKPPAFLVTGARTGIGRAVAMRLLEEGFEVIGLSRHMQCEDIPKQGFTPLACDLARLDDVKPAVKQVMAQTDNLVGAVFCAGRGLFGHLEQLSAQSIQGLINLNLTSQILAAQALLPRFKQQAQGHMIFIGSEAALQGTQKGTVYCASKFGLRGFCQALRAESSNAGIRVTLINPGMVDSAFFDQLSFKPGNDKANSISPETVADAVVWAISSPLETQIDEINLSPKNKVIQFATGKT